LGWLKNCQSDLSASADTRPAHGQAKLCHACASQPNTAQPSATRLVFFLPDELVAYRLRLLAKRGSAPHQLGPDWQHRHPAGQGRGRPCSGSLTHSMRWQQPAAAFEVIIITVLSKGTNRFWLSVKRPSSKICNNTFKISGWAFSTSSNKTTAYGFLRTASVNWPPSSYPT
jgi:hypothetical protein